MAESLLKSAWSGSSGFVVVGANAEPDVIIEVGVIVGDGGCGGLLSLDTKIS